MLSFATTYSNFELRMANLKINSQLNLETLEFMRCESLIFSLSLS